jgi:hypothetical protein
MHELNDIVPTTGITNIGTYEIYISVRDIANNWYYADTRYVSIYTTEDNIIETGYWDDDGIWIDIIPWF